MERKLKGKTTRMIVHVMTNPEPQIGIQCRKIRKPRPSFRSRYSFCDVVAFSTFSVFRI